MDLYKARTSIFLLLVVCLLVGILPQVSAITWDNEAYYKLDEASGTVLDATGNGYSAVNNGATPGVTGILNDAYEFNAVGDYIERSSNFSTAADGSFAFNVWVNITSYRNGHLAGYRNDETRLWRIVMINSTGNVGFGIRTPAELSIIRSAPIVLNTWNMITASYDFATTNMTLYVNGVLVVSGTHTSVPPSTPFLIGSNGVDDYINGTIDEIALFNRSLIVSDVIDLYNSGDALADEKSVELINLENPTNGTTLSDVGENFTVYGDVTSSFNVTNITYYVWNENGTVHNQTTVTLGDNQTFNEALYIDEFTLGDYVWNAEICYENATFGNCTFATSNYTFDVVPFSVLSESYLNETISGSTDIFTINLSVLSGFRMSTIDFVYNGTVYDTEFVEYSTGLYFVNFTQNIPQVTTDTNLTFYWAVELESGFKQNSTLHNQTIYNFAFDDCSVYTNKIFNFTIVDEDDQSFLNGITQNTSILIDLVLARLDSSDLSVNFSQKYTKINPANVCSNVDLDSSRFSVDGVIEYSASGKFVEFYNIRNYLLTNTTANQNITLYNLNSSRGQEFKITYKDSNFNLVPGALIQIQRKYVDEGVFKTVEIPIIGSAGYTIAHLVRNDIIYNLVIIEGGEVIATFNNIVADCQNPTFTECSININSFSTGIEPEDFSQDGEFSAVLSYDKDTRIVSTTYAIVSGIPTTTTLNVTLFDNLGNTSVCSDTLFSAGGTLSCTVPTSFGNSSILIKLTSGGEVKRTAIVRLGTDPSDIYGTNLIYISLCIMLFIIGMSVTDNPMTLGIMMVLGSIILIALNVTTTGAWIGNSSATILWFIVATVILFIKGSNRQ